ncbi:hypothetical protein K458DRAFT_431735 [Lentithecium fluviatile CBS 122367]|uniref:Uncharacterized protein n=1 Tax=Lentithecium fluviatile CBS 122367 TaxID=1168545 RepID=A0A6G1J0W4_9PLEO|nr:hypothetical protein K458DRAFT_431735 [Lentithecium fluviatile CBS 122367]
MLALLSPQIAATDAYFQSIITASNGNYRERRTDLHVNSISTTQIQATRLRWLKKDGDAFRRKLLNIHPEHYATLPIEGESIVEVIVEHVARLHVIGDKEGPEWVMKYGDEEYPFKKPTVLELGDGTIFAYILHEFRNTPWGRGRGGRMQYYFEAVVSE